MTRLWSGSLLVVIFAACLSYYLLPLHDDATTMAKKAADSSSLPKFNATGQSAICVALAAALPDSVYSEQHPTFQLSANSYWSQNARESKPACIVQPANTQEVAVAVRLLKAEFDRVKEGDEPLQFAVRGGGHAPERGFATVDQGVVVDMGRLNKVEVAEDRQSTTIGMGARWRDVAMKLDGMRLAMVGGRNSNVGVGGLALGGMCTTMQASEGHETYRNLTLYQEEYRSSRRGMAWSATTSSPTKSPSPTAPS
jgi:hypothetical protein